MTKQYRYDTTGTINSVERRDEITPRQKLEQQARTILGARRLDGLTDGQIRDLIIDEALRRAEHKDHGPVQIARTDAIEDRRDSMLERHASAWKRDGASERDAALREALPDDARARMLVANALRADERTMTLAEYRRQVVIEAARRWRR